MRENLFEILIVEDDKLTSQLLEKVLKNLNYKIISIVESAIEAIDILDVVKPDVVILDIHILGSKNGIWLGKKIQTTYNIPFIYLSADNGSKNIELALDTKPDGYLFKPFTKDQLNTSIKLAVNKFKDFQNENRDIPGSDIQTTIGNETIFIKFPQGYKSLKVADIKFIKSDLKYIEIHLLNTSYLVRYGLDEILKMLPKVVFIKIHRSYIINKNKIDFFTSTAVKIGDSSIPIGPKYQGDFLKRINII